MKKAPVRKGLMPPAQGRLLTPGSSPSRRRSLKVALSGIEDLPVSDDEAERQQRRRDSGHFGQLAEKRVSVSGLIDLSSAEAAAQYSNCLRLSAENKINHKNAFNLPLIDFMMSMLRKTQMNNFQAASTTLDASTKIYASRVDRVYMDGLHMAQGLGSARGRTGRGNTDSDGEMPDGPEGEAARRRCKPKKRKKEEEEIARAATLKLDGEVANDPTYSHLRKQFSDCQPGFINFVPCLELPVDTCDVLLNLTDPARACVLPVPEAKEVLPPVYALSSCENDEVKKQVCKTFRSVLTCDASDFDFDALMQQDMDKGLEDNDEDDDDDDYVNDIDADMGEAGVDRNLDGNTDGLALAEEPEELEGLPPEDGDAEGALAQCGAAAPMRACIVDIRKAMQEQLEVSAHASVDYSYLALDRMLWAGPTHWRALPRTRARVAQQGTDSRRRERKAVVLEFDGSEVQNIVVATKRQGLNLTRTYMDTMWSEDKITNPMDLHMDTGRFTKFFTQPAVAVRIHGQKEQKSAAPNDEGLSQYDYNNINDSQSFCPKLPEDAQEAGDYAEGDGDGAMNVDQDSDGNEQESTPAEDVHEVELGEEAAGGDWQLVDPPQKVAKIVVPYAQRAKRVDMKELKSRMWEILTAGSREGPEARGAVERSMQEPMLLSQLIQRLEGRLSHRTADDVSVPIVFTALLHLANEHKLLITGQDNYQDVTIVQETEPPKDPLTVKPSTKQYSLVSC